MHFLGNGGSGKRSIQYTEGAMDAHTNTHSNTYIRIIILIIIYVNSKHSVCRWDINPRFSYMLIM